MLPTMLSVEYQQIFVYCGWSFCVLSPLIEFHWFAKTCLNPLCPFSGQALQICKRILAHKTSAASAITGETAKLTSGDCPCVEQADLKGIVGKNGRTKNGIFTW